mmetsp:Transcript_25370/g.42166  ORF Transcript_25370/g.42166 Transcript_25370/m.42166 type:complete len:865 (-) Transcript_25370:92-2686(-)
MLLKTIVVLLSAVLLMLSVVAGAEKEAYTRDLQTTTFECILFEVATEFEDHASTFEHSCEAKDPDGDYDIMYSIDDNNAVIADKLGEAGLDVLHNSGRYKITLTNVIVNLEPVVSTTPESTVTIEDLTPDLDVGVGGGKDVGQAATTTTPTIFECILFEVATEFEDHTSIFEHICEGKGPDGDYDKMYSIDDNNDIIALKLEEGGLDIIHNSGRYKITLTNVIVDLRPVVSTTPDSVISIEDLGVKEGRDRRRLGKKVGDRSIAIFRVTGSDASPSYSASDISNAFFGTSGDPNNLKSRYAACSMDQLIFNPGTGNGFTNGVAELTVSAKTQGVNVHDLLNKVTDAVIARFGSSLKNSYDHIVYALPRGTTFGDGGSDSWLAFAYMNSYLSAYNDNNIMYISNQVHETGHNLGLMHSSHGGVTYGDQSGTMGYGYGKMDFPKMCFNAAKSWQLGWYADKAKEVFPEDGYFTAFLDAFVDYNSVSSGEYVLLKAGNMFIIYNRGKGINSETQEFADTVTVTEMKRESDYSESVAALASGGTFTFPYAGATAVIEICSMEISGGVDKAKISIYMQSSGSACNVRLAPAPSPGGGGFNACFSDSGLVSVKDRRGTVSSIEMKALTLGDHVLAGNGRYEKVYSFGHYEPGVTVEYLEIAFTGHSTPTKPLEVTDSHMVFVSNDRAVPASSFLVGDRVLSGTGDTLVVQSIRRVLRKGLYAPFTSSGTVVVNGVLSSCYMAFEGSASMPLAAGMELSYQFSCHLFFAPHRLWCSVAACDSQTYTSKGLSYWTDVPLKISLWLHDQSNVVKTVLIAVYLLMYVPLGLFELLTWNASFAMKLLVAGIIAALTRRIACRKTVPARPLRLKVA